MGVIRKKVVGAMFPIAPHRDFVVNFGNSKMSQFIAVVLAYSKNYECVK